MFKLAVIMKQFFLNEFILTESMLFSSVLSWAAPCCISFMALALLLLHTTLKWPILLHSVHLFPKAGYCLRGLLLPQYVYVSFAGILFAWVSRAVLVCDLYYFEFIKLLCLSEAVHDGRFGSLHFDSFCTGQHIFTRDFFIFMYPCEFPDNCCLCLPK